MEFLKADTWGRMGIPGTWSVGAEMIPTIGPGLFFAQWEVGIREMTWEAIRLEWEELGRLVKGCCISDQEKNHECYNYSSSIVLLRAWDLELSCLGSNFSSATL